MARRNSGAVISQCPDRVDGGLGGFAAWEGRHDVDVAKEPARDDPDPCRDARHVQRWGARHEGENHGTLATSVPAVRDLAQRLPTAAYSCPRARSEFWPSARSESNRPRIAARSNCRAGSSPIRMPADLFNRRSEAVFRLRRTVFRGWGPPSKKGCSRLYDASAAGHRRLRYAPAAR